MIPLAALLVLPLLLGAGVNAGQSEWGESAACSCSRSASFPDQKNAWHLLSLLLALLGCACAFLLGSIKPFHLCSEKISARKMAGNKPGTTLAHVNGVVKHDHLLHHHHYLQQQQQQQNLSIVEQLVPEITQHVLCYLDFKSLCSVSMTNLAMKKAANDESVWKSLYHKDWNPEQQNILPREGWKAYYAVTKAVVEANRAFYNKFRAKSLRGMAQLWLQADYVKCIHPGGELISGFDAVMENWRSVFNWSQRYDFELQDVKVRVRGDMAWVTSKAFVNASVEPLLSTNFYEFHEQQWFVVHHHCSPQLDFAVSDYGMFA